MTYFYFPDESRTFFETHDIIEWSLPTPLGKMKKYRVTAYTEVQNGFIAERLQWCQLHLKRFELWREGVPNMMGGIPKTSYWHFRIDDQEEAIMFKLRWVV